VRYLCLTLIVALAAGCSHSQRDWPQAPVVSQGREDLYKHFDSEVNVTGKAATDAKAGVMVVMDDGTRVMIPELKSWPARIAGKRVSVTGVLHRIPAPGDQPPKPEDQFVLTGVRWEPGKPPATQPTK